MAHLHEVKIKELERAANRIRRHIIESVAAAGSGHQGGALGMADVFAVLYFHALRHDPKDPEWSDRDRLVLSNGHICPVRYAAMAEAGYFPVEELLTLRKLGSRLQGHPERTRLPGLETTSGPLGAGLAQAAGMALAAKMDRKNWTTYCVTSDAEHAAGLHWEAALFAAKFKLDNLICIVDRNFIQIDGNTEDVMPLEPLREKYGSFGWRVIECNGNDIPKIVGALDEARTGGEKPVCVIARTVPGKGVSYMENDFKWHSDQFKDGQAKTALEEIDAEKERLDAE